jgi:predicted MFS family arabinose efflux permease
MFGLLLPYRRLLGEAAPTPTTMMDVMRGYRALVTAGRGRWTYVYVLLNAIFHSGVFTWLGVYFAQRHGLGGAEIGLALLGYGVPGFVLGPIIGRAADRWGRRWLLPAGIAISALAAVFLILDVPVVVATLLVIALSLGYDMTQPLLAGIVTSLGGKRSGQAMGLNVFCLFVGFGLGSLLFGEALRLGFSHALAIFAAVQFVAALAAIPLFRSETAPARPRP